MDKLIIGVLSLALLVCICYITYIHTIGTDKIKQNAILENILNRKSVRNYIKGKEITEEQINKILRAGMAAPSARNLQPWEFIVIKDRKTLESLAQKSPYGKMLSDASAAIIVAGNLNTEGVSEFWIQDTSAVTENMLLEIEALGLGAVWIGGYPKEERTNMIKEELKLPQNIVPLNIISIGYPTGKDLPKDKWKPEKVHYEKY